MNKHNKSPYLLAFLICACIFLHLSCKHEQTHQNIIGTWKLLHAYTIQGADTTTIDESKGEEMIKIITPTHFSFVRHDTRQGKDSTALYVSGAGRAMINDTVYTEYLDFCNFREWEGGIFHLHYDVHLDTLHTTAIEKVEKLGINQINHETYIRVK